MASKAKKTPKISPASIKLADRTRGFGEYLVIADEVFASLPEKDRNPLAGILYGAHIGKFSHNSGEKGEFPIHWIPKQEKFGSAAHFDALNKALGWFTKVRAATVGKSAEGWMMTMKAKKLLATYNDLGKQQHLPFFDVPDASRAFVDQDNRPCRKPQSPIASKASNGTNTNFRSGDLPLNVYVDGDNLHRFLHAATARLHDETCPRGFEWAWESWDGIETSKGRAALDRRLGETIAQAAEFLRTAWSSKLKGFVIHQSYEETTSGRLMAQGILNLQTCHREVRKACLPGHYDYDVECCHYALLASLAKRQEFSTPCIDAYINDKNKLRREVQMASGGSYEDAKRIITALIYGAPLTASPQGSIADLVGVSGADRLCRLQSLSDLYAELKATRNQVMEAHRQEIERTGRITNAAGRRIPAKGMRPSQLLSHVLTGEESEVLKAAIAYASTNIVLLAHDGFVATEPLNRAELVSRIKNHTGHDLSISEDIFPPAAR